MKKTFKKILASLLAVVLLFGAVPMSGTLKGVLGAEASAMESVSGSYDYLVNYLKNNGSVRTDGKIDGEHRYYTIDGVDVKDYVTYANDYISFTACFTIEKKYYQMELKINRSDAELYEMIVFQINKDSGAIEYAKTTVNAKTYKYGDSLDYSFERITSNKADYKKTLTKTYNSLVPMSLKTLESYLRDTVGYGLGNFGFTQISATAAVPSTSTGFLTILYWILFFIGSRIFLIFTLLF